jgi:5-methyltetrahydrofolate--homocysteine methyltransferase
MTKDALRRYHAFWNHEETDRPILHITVPKYEGTEGWDALLPKSMEDEWEDVGARYSRFRYQIEHSLYFAEAFPSDRAFLGSVCLAAMMGCDYKFVPQTVWFGLQDKIIKNWRDFDSITLDRKSPLFLLARDIYEAFGKNQNGQYRMGMTDLGGNLDILCPLRGTQELLFDLIEDPDEVTKAIEKTDRFFEEAFDYFYQIITSHGQKGMSSWMGIWCDNRYFPLQSDFAAMISPDQFDKFVIPSLKRACDYLDNSMFHLDGPSMLFHIDHLLALERLDGIQWTPGDGNPPLWDEKWFDLYSKVQAANKNLALLYISGADNVLRLCEALPPRGLFIHAILDTEEEALEVIGKLK